MGDIKLSMARIILIFAGLAVFIRIVTEEFACVTDLTIATYAEFVTLYMIHYGVDSVNLCLGLQCQSCEEDTRYQSELTTFHYYSFNVSVL